MEENYKKIIKKKARIRKQQKKRVSKTSGTLAGQVSRVKVSKGYLQQKSRNK